MTEASERIEVQIEVADYVSVDPVGKINMIGGGARVLAVQPEIGTTAPFALYVKIIAPMSSIGDAPAVEIVLSDANGAVVTLAGPEGPQALRIAQNIEFTMPQAPGTSLPRGVLPPSAQFAINFSNGLPLQAGLAYTWRVQIDHDVVGSYPFFVAAVPPGPVLG